VLRFEPDHILALTHLDLLENPPAPVPKPAPLHPFSKKELPPVTHEPSIETSPSQTLAAAFSPAPQDDAPKPRPAKKKSLSSSAKKEKRKKLGKNEKAAIIFFLFLGLLGVLYLGYRLYTNLNQMSAPPIAQAVSGAATSQPLLLPPTWTYTPSKTPLATHTPFPTAKPTRTPPPMATYTKPPRIVGAAVGQYAPDFTLKNLDGEKVSLSDYAGKPIVLIFWATWCPYCEQEVPALKSVYQNYQSQGLVVLAVNSGDSASKVKKYRSSHQINYPIVLDSNKKISNKYHVSGVPYYYLINANGKIIYAASGMFGQTALENNVRVLIADTSQ